MIVQQLNECLWRAVSGGAGDLEVASHVTGYYTPAECASPTVVDGAFYRYRAESDDLSQVQSGVAPFDVATSTLKLTDPAAEIHQSSNGGSQVTFSAAPKVMMGAGAQDVVSGRWELLAETVIGSPVAQVEHAIPRPDDYWQFMIDVSQGTVDDVDPPSTYLTANLVDASVAIDGSNTGDYAQIQTSGDGNFAYNFMFTPNLTNGTAFGNWNGTAEALGGTPPLTALKAVYSGLSRNDTDMRNMTAGRLRTFGLRK